MLAMKILRVSGGRPLFGELVVSGSKNAALPILAATLLIRGTVELIGLPEIRDVSAMLHLLSLRGVRVEHLERGRYRLNAEEASPSSVAFPEDGGLRGSIYLLGAGLAAHRRSAVGLPGGCDFGERPHDLHCYALRAFGAKVLEREKGLYAEARSLVGGEIRLSYPSVGATVNAILAATLAKGRSVIYGAAREPHVMDLISFLNRSGARIKVLEQGTVAVSGVERLAPLSYRVMPDMIEAGSYLLMAAATRGEIHLRRAPEGQLASLLPLLSESGCRVWEIGSDEIALEMRGRPKPISVTTEPYPGFPTDLHPQLSAYLALCLGESRIREMVFRDRFRYLTGLSAFGANVTREGREARIVGRERLFGARVTAPDLRAAAAYLTAAMAAEGESLILSAELLLRGYEAPLRKLRRLGAVISDADVECGVLPQADRRAARGSE